MTSSESASRLEQSELSRPETGRPVVYGTQGVISSGHYLTSMAGMRMLLSGGNAFDAVVASGFAAAVIEPIAAYSLTAEGVFMLYHAESGQMLSLSGQGTAPGKANVDFYRSKGFENIPTGPGPDAPLSFTVPGVVAAYLSMLERFGTKTVGEVLAPAVHYAQFGIPMYDYMRGRLRAPASKEQFDHFPPGGTDIFFENGEPLSAGSLIVQNNLGTTLKKMAEAESAAAGHRSNGVRAARDEFYGGSIARMLIDNVERVGGIMSMEDLAGFEAKYEEPLKTTFMGHEIHGQSTWTQGIVVHQALNILEGFDLRAMGHNSPQYIHTVLEAVKLAFADREAYYGDPDFVTVPTDGLLSKQYAAERAKLIDAAKARVELPSAGDPWRFSKLEGRPTEMPVIAGGDGASGDDGGTTHIAAIDRDGNMACATPSGGSFAKSVFFPDLGCSPSTRIEMFNFNDGHPNRLEPGKRPRTTLINYIVSKNGVPVMTVGCPGGDHQAQANIQLMLNALVFGMNPQEAIEAPRFATEGVTNSFYPHVYYPGRVSLEAGFSDSTRDALAGLGHREIVTAASCGMGATIAVRDPETGVLATGGDPRRACYAIGW
ncbi:MAG: gamma-glutamyltransferase family protein [Chloroflexi bacterium]|nr:gamma-glutamyltransferase family protein [Chloroflexota bacterium]